MGAFSRAACQVIDRCRTLAQFTEEPGFTTRTFLCEPMREVHRELTDWMTSAGMEVLIDAAGNIRGVYPATHPGARRLYIGSHLDTVPRAGAFDGVLGVMMGLALVELAPRRFNYAVELVGFSEEEGVRFGIPFIGSRALAGLAIEERTVQDAIRAYGLDPGRIAEAQAGPHALGYFEIHIEQGPVLDSMGAPLAVVDSIVGQSRFEAQFAGAANHAGVTPMHLRRDALVGAAEWIGAVEREAKSRPDLVATVGRIEASPGATNVIPGTCRATLDVRSPSDAVRRSAVEHILECGRQIAKRRSLRFESEQRLDQPAVSMDESWTALLEEAVEKTGAPVHRMASGAGHDAMIMAQRMPAAMLFLRTPGGISHHPDETVRSEDIAAGLAAALEFLNLLEARVA